MIRLTRNIIMWESPSFSHPGQTNGTATYTFNHNMGRGPIEKKLLYFDASSNGIWSVVDQSRDSAFNNALIYGYSTFDISANTTDFYLNRITGNNTATCKAQIFFE